MDKKFKLGHYQRIDELDKQSGVTGNKCDHRVVTPGMITEADEV